MTAPATGYIECGAGTCGRLWPDSARDDEGRDRSRYVAVKDGRLACSQCGEGCAVRGAAAEAEERRLLDPERRAARDRVAALIWERRPTSHVAVVEVAAEIVALLTGAPVDADPLSPAEVAAQVAAGLRVPAGPAEPAAGGVTTAYPIEIRNAVVHLRREVLGLASAPPEGDAEPAEANGE